MHLEREAQQEKIEKEILKNTNKFCKSDLGEPLENDLRNLKYNWAKSVHFKFCTLKKKCNFRNQKKMAKTAMPSLYYGRLYLIKYFKCQKK